MRAYFYLILLSVYISAEVITLIKDQKVKCVITGESVYSAIEVTPWVEFKRPVENVENWNSTFGNDWYYCNETECAETFDAVTDQRWEGFDAVCSDSGEIHRGAMKLKEYRQFFSLYFESNSTTEIKVLEKQISDPKSTDITFEAPEKQWNHNYLKKNGNYFEIKGDPISKNVSIIDSGWVAFYNKRKTCRKLHKYNFMYSNFTGESSITISNNSLNCIFMYISVDENCFLEVRFEKGNNTVRETVEGFNKDKTFRKWRPFNITNNSEVPGLLYLSKRNSTNESECFWAVAEIQKCRNKTEFYNVGNGTRQNKHHICRSLKTGNNTGRTFSVNEHFDVPNKLFNCSEVLGSSFTKCEKHKLCLENGTCFCSWGYKGSFCNETCQNNFWGLDCNHSCNTKCDKCDPFKGCTECKENFIGDQCQSKVPTSPINEYTPPISTSQNINDGKDEAKPPVGSNEHENDNNYSSTKNNKNQHSTEKTDDNTTKNNTTTPKSPTKPPTTNVPPENEKTENNALPVALGVTFLIVVTLVTAIATLWLCKSRKKKRIPLKQKGLFESYLLIEKGNNSADSNLIELDKFENYLLESLEEDPDNNKITQEYDAMSKTPSKTRTSGQLPENSDKNRYRNIIPYDDSRVILKTDDSQSDYINANYIDGFNTPRSFIATQAPLPSTLLDFWLMIYQEKVTTIIMLTKLTENGLVKCEQYWPEVQSKCRFGRFLVENVSEKVFPNYTVRQLQVLCDNQTHFLQHFQYVTWPDHGVPLYTQDYIRFLKKIMRLPQKAPIVVHCNAGCGRTGTFILSDIAVRMAIHEKQVDFPKLLSKIRDQRQGLVSNVDQYIFVYSVILEYFFRKDFSIFVSNNYQYDVKKAMEKESLDVLVEYLEKATMQVKKNRDKYNLQLTEEEKNKNRFSHLLPGLSRVFLPIYSSSSSKYINAINVDCYLCPKKFIVTQQPLPNTVEDFWTLVKEYDIDTIISLNEIPENDPNCPIFWPRDAYEAWLFGNDLKVTFQNQSNNDLYKTVKVKFDVDRRAVSVIDVKGWSRGSLTPKSVHDLIRIWKKVVTGTNQIVVTCHDGTTASGLFVALVFLLEKLNMDHVCDVFSAVKSVRESRLEFVQHVDQLVFLYRAALEYIREFSTYGNFN